MKNIKLILIAAVVLGATAFTQAQTKKSIDTATSSIKWTGKKVLGSHEGTINFSEGYLEMDGEKLSGGIFTVDMTSMQVTDLKAGKGKEKLEGHLTSDDFFGIASHPMANLIIKSVKGTSKGYTATGDLTIKGHTETITFDLTMDGNSMLTSLKVDRTKYGIQYGSGSFFDGLGDKTISDNFELDILLKF